MINWTPVLMRNTAVIVKAAPTGMHDHTRDLAFTPSNSHYDTFIMSYHCLIFNVRRVSE